MSVMDTHKRKCHLSSPEPALLVTWAASSVSCGQSGLRDGPQGAVVWLQLALPPPSPQAHSPRGGRRPLMLEWPEEQDP